MPRHPEPPPSHPEPPPSHPEPPPGQPQPAPTAAGFDATFSAVPASPGLRKVWQLAMPELPPEIEPFSFVSLGLLRHVARALNLAPGQTLVDLGCGRGGPGLWLARTANVSLTGVDFSPVAIEQATQRAALFGLAGRARLVLTNWQPKHPGDRRLPPRARIDWPPLLRKAGFTDIDMAERPGWHALWTRLYQVALDLGDPGDDTLLADLQDEARRRLPLAGLRRRVVVTASS
jgi:Methyltransferase domain